MKTDQTIALYLRDTSKGMALEAERLRGEGGGHPVTQTTRLLNERASELEAQSERLEEIVEALASGTLKIVDEYLAVKFLELEVQRDRDREPADEAEAVHYSPLRVAQLAFRAMEEKGAIR